MIIVEVSPSNLFRGVVGGSGGRGCGRGVSNKSLDNSFLHLAQQPKIIGVTFDPLHLFSACEGNGEGSCGAPKSNQSSRRNVVETRNGDPPILQSPSQD